jgi:hypothetical protein
MHDISKDFGCLKMVCAVVAAGRGLIECEASWILRYHAGQLQQRTPASIIRLTADSYARRAKSRSAYLASIGKVTRASQSISWYCCPLPTLSERLQIPTRRSTCLPIFGTWGACCDTVASCYSGKGPRNKDKTYSVCINEPRHDEFSGSKGDDIGIWASFLCHGLVHF